MLLASRAALLLQLSAVLGCPSHSNTFRSNRHAKRQITIDLGRNPTDWAYEASYNWGMINPAYSLCQNGMQQSPIPLGLNQGLAHHRALSFPGYTGNFTGNWYNWGFGPAFSLFHEGLDHSTLPAMSFDDETVYLKGWHIHAPADHRVGGMRSKAEMHFVHVNKAGNYRSVVAFRLDPGPRSSNFFASLPPMIEFNDTKQIEGVSLNHRMALDEVNMFSEYWTYKGSLTSPPCTEGVQWFMARTVLSVSNKQMQDILHASTYSARAEQEVWLHEINV